MRYLIIKICCFDCKSIKGIYVTDKDYYDFIKSFNDYKDFSYYVFDTSFTFRYMFDGTDMEDI